MFKKIGKNGKKYQKYAKIFDVKKDIPFNLETIQ